MSEIRKTIKAKMEEQGLNTSELSRLTKVRYASLINFLNGKKELTTANIDKLNSVLEIY